MILCTLLGCAPAAPEVTAPAEPSATPSVVARADASASPDEQDPEGVAIEAPPSSTVPTSERSPVGGNSVEPAAGDATPTDTTTPTDTGPVVIAAAAVPKFARLDFKPRSLGKRRARIRRAGPMYAPSSLVPLTDEGKRDWLALEVKVLDADVSGSPRRPRVLCENEASRLGVAVDAQDLSTTVRSKTFVGPRPTPPKRPTSKTPGLRLAGGTEVEVRAASVDGATQIGYRGLFLVAEGFVASEALDVVYTPGELEDDMRRNGELLDDVWFLDAPNGIEIARTERAAGIANTIDVFRLGPVEDDHMLVRYQESEALVVGWVPSKAIRSYEAEELGWGSLSARGSGREQQDSVELKRGTRLVPTSSEEVIGVITKDHSVPCVLGCDGPNPHVLLPACSRTLTLRAVP